MFIQWHNSNVRPASFLKCNVRLNYFYTTWDAFRVQTSVECFVDRLSLRQLKSWWPFWCHVIVCHNLLHTVYNYNNLVDTIWKHLNSSKPSSFSLDLAILLPHWSWNIYPELSQEFLSVAWYSNSSKPNSPFECGDISIVYSPLLFLKDTIDITVLFTSYGKIRVGLE